MAIRRRTAPELIGFHFGWDQREVSENRYQSTVYINPAIYTIGENYACAPANNKPPRKMEGNWQEVGEYYGRKVFLLEI